jgi:hypothetical protein
MSRRIRLAALSALLTVIVASAFVLPAARASIDGVISFAFQVNDRRTVGLNTSANLPVNTAPSISFTNGAGAGQAKILYQGNLTLSSGTLSVDLNGVLADSYGSTVSLVRVKGIFIKNTATTPLVVGAAGSNPWNTLLNSTGTLTLPASAWVAAATPDATGWAVTASTGDLLLFTGTGSGTFQVVILGSDT